MLLFFSSIDAIFFVLTPTRLVCEQRAATGNSTEPHMVLEKIMQMGCLASDA
jgi:hypothetical protein